MQFCDPRADRKLFVFGSSATKEIMKPIFCRASEETVKSIELGDCEIEILISRPQKETTTLLPGSVCLYSRRLVHDEICLVLVLFLKI